jgi:hypothetical protein
MIDGQEKHTVFLKPLVTPPKIEVENSTTTTTWTTRLCSRPGTRTIWTGTPADLEQEAKDAGLLN